ncbi:hypothetical protein SR80_11445 [Enterobacter hormaechei subsp. xiangfangensis]|nr:hypothetical protein LI63_015830 [Enterobacter hormaechei subsp. xiangfangensis]APR41132.1 hypothetical protein AM329_03370 [Enterobacter cloacae complex sp. AR_0002]KHQ57727.1 hypothetical protein KV13_11805 [Enterobacter hormaechei subsp. oharae]KJH94704.1 hypothetical protein UO80_07255 [Enterobacter hormaechei]KHC12931.1 hypothetical protein KV26_31575 [Enterobacter hormaechei subsp. xiangfangensis]
MVDAQQLLDLVFNEGDTLVSPIDNRRLFFLKAFDLFTDDIYRFWLVYLKANSARFQQHVKIWIVL